VSLRLIAVVAELALSALVAGWGIASALQPDLWRRRPAQWWVGWTSEAVGRWDGVGVALAGAGTALSGVAALLATPTPTLPPAARGVQLTGLGLLVVAAALLVVVHPSTSPPATSDHAPSRRAAPAVTVGSGG
jgi:hypothetical protein